MAKSYTKALTLAKALKKTMLDPSTIKYDSGDGVYYQNIEGYPSLMIEYTDDPDLDHYSATHTGQIGVLYVPIPKKYMKPSLIVKINKGNFEYIPTLLIHEATHLVEKHNEGAGRDSDPIRWLKDPQEMEAVHNEWIYAQKHHTLFQYDEDSDEYKTIMRDEMMKNGYTDVPYQDL